MSLLTWLDIAAMTALTLFAAATTLLAYWFGVRDGMARAPRSESCCRGGLWDVPDYPPDPDFELEHKH
ncbi:MAG: hypothetical protein M3O70_09015 [Actinomycetota bacterium]|nr:hypothetical protein [Actinomycetota bacterium]